MCNNMRYIIILEIEKDNEPQDLADIVFVLTKNKFLSD